MALEAAHYQETRLWLAGALDETAEWRVEKARDYPDDPRNIQSANALRVGARYVRVAGVSPGVHRIAGLVDDCLASGIDLLGSPELPGAESERIAGRYHFDRFTGLPAEEEHEQLLADLYDAILRDLQASGVSPTSPLGRRLTGETPQPKLRAGADAGPRPPRLEMLSRIATQLVELADAANAEADEKGRLPGPLRPTRLPILRRRLGISTSAALALGSGDLAACRKLVDEPPQSAQQTVADVISALEEVQRIVDSEVSA